jgi:hypothetical protein
MALTQQEKDRIAKELAKKRAVMGDTAFQSYLGKIEQAMPQVKANRQAAQNSYDTDTKTKGALGAVSRFTGVEGLGVGLGTSIATNTGSTDGLQEAVMKGSDIQLALAKRIREKKSRGEDTSRLERTLDDARAASSAGTQAAQDLSTGGVTNRDVVGSAIRTAGTIASFGTFGGTGATTGALSKVTTPTLATANTIGRGTVQGFGRGAAIGAKSGGTFGAVSGVASGIEQNKGVLGTAFEAAKQGAAGVLVGGALGGAVGGVGGAMQARQSRSKEIEAILTQSDDVDDALSKATIAQADNVPPSPVTSTTQSPTTSSSKQRAGLTVKNGKITTDPKAKELLRQGIDDKSVAIVQSMTPEDKAAAKRMVSVAKRAGDADDVIARPQEVVGETFMRRAKDAERLNTEAGKQIDDIARTKLSGKQVDYTPAYDDFVSKLERHGIDVDALASAEKSDDVANAFRGSDFEDLPTAQRTIKTVLNRVKDGNVDGYNLHRTKRFIDNQVTYGKNAEGLTGDAERLLKGLRRGIDEVLDTALPEYNAVNTQYRDTIEAIDEVRRLIGKEYIGAGNIQNLRAGEVMNRLLGNASAKPLSALQNLENVNRKYGVKYADNVIKQIKFADLLDDVYELHPTRGFTGQTARGVEQAATNFLGRIRQSGLISASIDTAADTLQSVRGVSPEGAQKALEAFLD